MVGRCLVAAPPRRPKSATMSMTQEIKTEVESDPPSGSVRDIVGPYLKLGLTSFGGPVAHIGYFRRELVEKRRWVSESEFAQLIALTQFLPGPASSQLGFSLGLVRAGWLGGVMAFALFTLPSALVMFAFAYALPNLTSQAGIAAVHGLKLVAVAVVAHGLMGMARRLCSGPRRASIAALGAAAILTTASPWAQLGVIGFGAAAGVLFCRPEAIHADRGLPLSYGPRSGLGFLTIFVVLLAGFSLWAGEYGLPAMAAGFYQAGALVFGGGHVVLPLLEETVVGSGWVPGGDFLAGYGAAQAVPGPMFSFSAFLGARLPGVNPALGAGVALVAIFLPGFLLVSGVLPFWKRLSERREAAAAIMGVNAAVVGLLGAALYDPVWTSSVEGPPDVAIAVIGFTLLSAWRVSALAVVAFSVVASLMAALL